MKIVKLTPENDVAVFSVNKHVILYDVSPIFIIRQFLEADKMFGNSVHYGHPYSTFMHYLV